MFRQLVFSIIGRYTCGAARVSRGPRCKQANESNVSASVLENLKDIAAVAFCGHVLSLLAWNVKTA